MYGNMARVPQTWFIPLCSNVVYTDWLTEDTAQWYGISQYLSTLHVKIDTNKYAKSHILLVDI